MSVLDEKALDAAYEALRAMPNGCAIPARPAMEAAIRAYLEATAPSGQAPLEGVKALEWSDREDDEPDVIGSGARTSIGDYWTSWDGREEKRWVVYFGTRLLPGRYQDEHEAKAAAQAHFNAAISSSLLPASAEPVAEPTEKAAREVMHGVIINALAEYEAKADSWQLEADIYAALKTAGFALYASPPASGAVEAGWQTMDSAPKNRPILGWNDHETAYICQWFADEDGDGDWLEYGTDVVNPVRWMPLPAAPTEGRSPDRGEG